MATHLATPTLSNDEDASRDSTSTLVIVEEDSLEGAMMSVSENVEGEKSLKNDSIITIAMGRNLTSRKAHI